MSQQMRRTLAAVGLVAALLLAVPAPSRAATFQGPMIATSATSLVARIWTWLWSPAQTAPVGQASTPATRTGNPPPQAGPPPFPSNESGSMIDPDGKP